MLQNWWTTMHFSSRNLRNSRFLVHTDFFKEQTNTFFPFTTKFYQIHMHSKNTKFIRWHPGYCRRGGNGPGDRDTWCYSGLGGCDLCRFENSWLYRGWTDCYHNHSSTACVDMTIYNSGSSPRPVTSSGHQERLLQAFSELKLKYK